MKNILLTATTTTTDNPFKGLFEGVESIMGDITPFLPIIVAALILIVGLMLLSGKKGREFVKDNVIWFIVGISLVLGASIWASYIIGKFQF